MLQVKFNLDETLIRECKKIAKHLAVIGLVFLMASCDSSTATIWSAAVKSPDGIWIATANTSETAGFGTGYVDTAVFVKRTKGSQPPIMILDFTNENGRPIGVTAVKMAWTTPSHLDVTYKPIAHLNFQVVKCAGLDISVHQAK